jgi:hypothetical protein
MCSGGGNNAVNPDSTALRMSLKHLCSCSLPCMARTPKHSPRQTELETLGVHVRLHRFFMDIHMRDTGDQVGRDHAGTIASH